MVVVVIHIVAAVADVFVVGGCVFCGVIVAIVSIVDVDII